jgi:hypothetical protein
LAVKKLFVPDFAMILPQCRDPAWMSYRLKGFSLEFSAVPA